MKINELKNKNYQIIIKYQCSFKKSKICNNGDLSLNILFIFVLSITKKPMIAKLKFDTI